MDGSSDVAYLLFGKAVVLTDRVRDRLRKIRLPIVISAAIAIKPDNTPLFLPKLADRRWKIGRGKLPGGGRDGGE